MELGIGPLSFSLTGDVPEAARLLALSYPPPAEPAGRHILHFIHEAGAPFIPLPPPHAGARYQLDVEERAEEILCSSYFFRARLPQSGAPGARLTAEALWRPAPPDHEPLIVHNILRNWAAYLLPRHGIVLLHAGGVVIRDKAVLFTGTSGAGKSTATAFCGEFFPTLGDDIVGLDFRAAEGLRTDKMPMGCAGEISVLPIPCFNAKAPPTAPIRPWPLGMINKLVKAEHHRLEKLSPPAALATLVSQAPFINVRSASLETGLDLLAEHIRQLPVFRLELLKNPGFIPLLEQEMAGPRGA
jgi:hypothetical protein